MFGPYFGDFMGSDYFAEGPSVGIAIPVVGQVERQLARIQIGGTTVAIVIVDRELADALTEAGYDWTDYNHLRWPIGASRHASGKFLFHASGIETLQAAGIHSSPFILQIGDSEEPVSIQNLLALPPEPLFVSTRGAREGSDAAESVRLYALPIVDTRYHSRNSVASQNFNLLGPDRQTFNTETTDVDESPFTYDEIGALLAADAGLTFSVAAGSERSTNPFDLRVQGLSASIALDRLLTESGRVFILRFDGVSTVENVDQRQVTQVLTTVRERIITGGVGYATPAAIGDAFITEISPLAIWSSQEVPVTVAVSFPTLDGTTPANDPTVKRIVATNNAATFSLSAGLDAVRDIPDSMPIVDPDEVSGAELARVEFRALQYYRRYVAGSMDVWIAGIVTPTMGGSCQELIWYFDDIRGVRTRARADFNLDLYGDELPESGIMAGTGIQIVRRPGGDAEARLIDGVDTKMGKITENTAVGGLPLFPTDALYKAISNDGAWEVTEFERPLYRPYDDVPTVFAAPVDSDCRIALIDDVFFLWSCDERLVHEVCDQELGFANNPTVDAGTDDWVTGTDGSVVTGTDGNVVVAAGTALAGNPENLVVVGTDGEVVADVFGNVVIEDDPSTSSDFYDRVGIGTDGDVVVGTDGDVVIEWDGSPRLLAPVPGA